MLAGVVSIVVASCTSGAPVPATSTAETPARGGRIVQAILADVTSLDPLLVSDGGQFDVLGLVTGQMYEPLVAADRTTGEIVPSLATWTISADARTYEFEIASPAVWSDGRPIIAEDFVTTVRALARSKKAGRGGLARIEGFSEYKEGRASAISGLRADGKRLSVRLNAVFCPILSLPLLSPPLPTHMFGRYLSDVDLSMNTDDAPEHLAPPVSSGPFVFKEWRRGDEIVLRANERYWRGAPSIDELIYRVVDRSALSGQFRSGTVQVASLGPSEVELIRELDSGEYLRIVRSPAPNYSYIGWNTRSQSAPALRDRRIRQALAYGLDVDRAVREILRGEGTRTRQHMAATSWAHTPAPNEYAYDPARAEALIRSAGYSRGTDGLYQKDSRPLAFTLVTNETNTLRAALVQFAADQYGAIGIRVTPKLEEFASLTKRLIAGDPTLEAHLLGQVSVSDPNPAAVWSSKVTASPGVPINLVGYVNPELEKAIDDGRLGPECSIAARQRAYEAFDRILNEDQPYNFLFSQNQFVVLSTRVRGVKPGAHVPLPDSHLWWLAPAK